MEKISQDMQARKDLAEREDAREVVGWFRQFHLGKSDAVLLATLQSVIGFGLIAEVDSPWSLLGYAFVIASALMFGRMKAVLAEFDKEDGAAQE
jgi:hypothetical protein